MRVAFVALFLPALILLPLSLSADPDEDLDAKLRVVQELMRRLEEAKAAGETGLEFSFEREDKTTLRVYNVADLTVRTHSFIPPNLWLMPAGAEIDEDQPLFGRIVEGDRFFGGPEEILDLVTGNVRPDLWDSDLGMIAVSGEFALIVVAEPEVQQEVGDYLSFLRQTVGRLITVEVRVLQIADGHEGDLPRGGSVLKLSPAEGLELLTKAEAGEGLAIAHSARVTGFNGQQIGLHRGGQTAFIQDWDVEVAQNSMISDPIVSIVQTGLSFRVRPIARGEELVILDLYAQICKLAEDIRTVETGSGPVMIPEQRIVEFGTAVTVPEGGFALVGSRGARGAGKWAMLVSARIERISSGEKGGAK